MATGHRTVMKADKQDEMGSPAAIILGREGTVNSHP